jgi:hypothetical protein
MVALARASGAPRLDRAAAGGRVVGADRRSVGLYNAAQFLGHLPVSAVPAGPSNWSRRPGLDGRDVDGRQSGPGRRDRPGGGQRRQGDPGRGYPQLQAVENGGGLSLLAGPRATRSCSRLSRNLAMPGRTRTRCGPRRRLGSRRLTAARCILSATCLTGSRSLSPSGAEHGCCHEFAVMYRITVSASRLTAYRSESGSFSETRHTPSRLSQNAVQDRCSPRKAATLAAA